MLMAAMLCALRLAQVFLTDDYLVLAMEYAPGGDLFKVGCSGVRVGRLGVGWPDKYLKWACGTWHAY